MAADVVVVQQRTPAGVRARLRGQRAAVPSDGALCLSWPLGDSRLRSR